MNDSDPTSSTTRPDPGEYTAFEQKLAQAMNKEAFAPHAKDEWPVFLPHARVAIRALIEMGVSIGR